MHIPFEQEVFVLNNNIQMCLFVHLRQLLVPHTTNTMYRRNISRVNVLRRLFKIEYRVLIDFFSFFLPYNYPCSLL